MSIIIEKFGGFDVKQWFLAGCLGLVFLIFSSHVWVIIKNIVTERAVNYEPIMAFSLIIAALFTNLNKMFETSKINEMKEQPTQSAAV